MNKPYIIKRAVMAGIVLAVSLVALVGIKLATSSFAAGVPATVSFTPSTSNVTAGNTFDIVFNVTTTSTSAAGFSGFKVVLRYTNLVDILTPAEGGGVSIIGNGNYTNKISDVIKGTDASGPFASFVVTLPPESKALSKSVMFKLVGRALKSGSSRVKVDILKTEVVGETGDANPAYAVTAKNRLTVTSSGAVVLTPVAPTPTGTTAVGSTASITAVITNGADDASLTGSTFTATRVDGVIGKDMTTSANLVQVFRALAVPRDAKITNATLTYGLAGSGGNTSDATEVKIAAQNIGNATAPATATQFNSIQTNLTINKILWTNVPRGGWGDVISSPNIAAVIQEVVNRADWQSGNSIAILIADNNTPVYANSRIFTGNFTGAGVKPTLKITFATGAVVPILPTATPTKAPATPTPATPTRGVTILPSVTPTKVPTAIPTSIPIVGASEITFPVIYNGIADVYYKDLTFVAQVGTVTSAAVSSNGAAIASTYNRSAGTLVFTTHSTPITITLSEKSSVPVTIKKAPLKGNKKWAWSHSFDDNVYLEKSVNVLSAKGWKGLFYLIGSSVDPTRNETSWIFDKPYLVNALNNGWSIGNHSYDHDCNVQTSTTAGIQTVLKGYAVETDIVAASNRKDYKVIAFAAPCYASGYSSIIPTLRSSRQTDVKFNETGGNGLMVINEGTGNYSANGLTADAVSSQTVNLGRDGEIDWALDNVKGRMAWMAANSTSTRNFWLNTYLHGQKEANLENVVNYVYSSFGPGGTNELWMAPADEVYSYLLVRDNAVIGQVVQK